MFAKADKERDMEYSPKQWRLTGKELPSSSSAAVAPTEKTDNSRGGLRFVRVKKREDQELLGEAKWSSEGAVVVAGKIQSSYRQDVLRQQTVRLRRG